jgi:hypothetical protein
MKHHELFDAFIRINIDADKSTKKRPSIFYDIQRELNIKILEVPTIITPGPEYVLPGADAFDWLEQITAKKETSLQGFNPIEMGSFSDSYSTYGSSDLYDAREQSFKFIGKADEKIETPPETSSVSKDDYARKQQERETFDNVNSKPKFGSNKESFNPMINNQSNFPNPRGNISEKQKDFDSKFQQMMAERENFGQTIQRK